MIYINNEKEFNNFKGTKNFYVITDFDRTLTTKDSEPSMGIVPKYLGGECLRERTKIFEYYRPLELDYTIKEQEKQKIMKEWANKSFTLLSKYLTQGILDKALKNANIHFRKGAKEFLIKMNNMNIPVIIMSSGVGNIIEAFLKKEGCLFNNIEIVSNFFEFQDEIAHIDLDSIMATLNKEYRKIPQNVRNKLEQKENALLFGDLIEDIKMANEEKLSNTITFGFLDANVEQNLEAYKNNFDIVITDDNNFNDVIKILNIN